MIGRLLQSWEDIQSSFWFVPALIVSFAVGFATFLIAIDVNVDIRLESEWPLLFGALFSVLFRGCHVYRGLLVVGIL
jgi:hypothetical protein